MSHGGVDSGNNVMFTRHKPKTREANQLPATPRVPAHQWATWVALENEQNINSDVMLSVLRHGRELYVMAELRHCKW